MYSFLSNKAAEGFPANNRIPQAFLVPHMYYHCEVSTVLYVVTDYGTDFPRHCDFRIHSFPVRTAMQTEHWIKWQACNNNNKAVTLCECGIKVLNFCFMKLMTS